MANERSKQRKRQLPPDRTFTKPDAQLHERLMGIVPRLPTDYRPYGKRIRRSPSDCSCGCRWYLQLAGKPGLDWGVCSNPTSPRSALLTFEHQGCSEFELASESSICKPAAGKRMKKGELS